MTRIGFWRWGCFSALVVLSATVGVAACGDDETVGGDAAVESDASSPDGGSPGTQCLAFDPVASDNIEHAFDVAKDRAAQDLTNPSVEFLEVAAYSNGKKTMCDADLQWTYDFVASSGMDFGEQVIVHYPGWDVDVDTSHAPIGALLAEADLPQVVQKTLEEIVAQHRDAFDACLLKSVVLHGTIYYERGEMKTKWFWEVDCAGTLGLLYFDPTTGDTIDATQ